MTDSTEDPPKKKSGKLKIILGVFVLLGVGAGGAFGAFHFGLIGSPAQAEEANEPLLVRKGEDDPYLPENSDKDAIAIVEGEGGSEYRTSYYSFEEVFTANLKNSPGLIQVSLAASTRRDGRVLQWLQRHEIAIRSEIIVALGRDQ